MHIYLNFAEKKILVNTVDDLDKCGFIFPAVVHKMILPSGFPPPVRVRYLRHIYA